MMGADIIADAGISNINHQPEGQGKSSSLWDRTHYVRGWNHDCKVQIVVSKAKTELKLKIDDGPERLVDCLNPSFEALGHSPRCNLQRGLSHKASDCFVHLYHIAVRASFDDYCAKLGPLDYFYKAQALRSLVQFIRAGKKEFISQLDPARLKISRKFPARRWAVYHWLSIFESEYVLQLMNSCPALIGVWAVGMDRGVFSSEWMVKTVDLVNRGVNLKSLIANTFDALWELDNSPFDCWKDLRTYSGRTREEIKSDWNWIIRAAPALANPSFLLLPPPVHLPKSTYPKNPRAQAMWLMRPLFMRASWLPEAHGVSTVQIQGVLNLFISKPEFYKKLISYNQSWQFARFLSATNRHPNTSTNINVLMSEFRSWAKQRKSQQYHILKMLQYFPETFLHDFFFEYSDGDLKIQSINRYCDLQDEGEKMAHCVGSQWLQALRSEAVHLHIDFKGLPYTAAIRRRDGKWYLHELKGNHNATPPGDLLEALRAPLVTINVQWALLS